MDLYSWSWTFLVIYVGGMLTFGYIASKRVENADDFATARRGYGPVFLGIAFAATTASGATFLGFPGLVYEWGLPSLWSAVLYPGGVFVGVLICVRLVSTMGNRFGSRSIPEYLGDRYQSDGIRILVALASLLLFFYLAGQLVSGLVMFEIMLGLEPLWALIITSVVLLIYVSLGGAHADILTDGIQGFLMLLIAILVIFMFFTGAGLDGGLGAVVDRIKELDEDAVGFLNKNSPHYHHWWSIVAIFLAHIPLGLLPHIGNKMWALRSDGDRKKFVGFIFTFGLTIGMLGLGGGLARAVLGDQLLAAGASPNQSLPLLFIELFPAWLAALIGVGILAAVMSTADGLVVSSSQIIANDLYRRTLAPKFFSQLSHEQVERNALVISRWATVSVMVACAVMGWFLLDMNVAILVWSGNGGMMAALAGPLVLGALWSRVTKAGAYAGIVTGMISFSVLYLGLIDPNWFAGTPLFDLMTFIANEKPNPISCAAMGELVAVTATVVVSLLTKPLPKEHLDELFGKDVTKGSEARA